MGAALGQSQKVARGLPAISWDGNLTNSCRTTFWNCRKKFEWGYLRRLSGRDPYIPFLVGGIFHDELEIMYDEGKYNESKARDRIAAKCEKACRTPGISSAQSDKVWAQQALAFAMVNGYAHYWLKADLKRYKVIETEKAFKLKMGKGMVYRGKRDMMVKRKNDKKLFLVEHKTTARLDAAYISKLPLDSQILGYAMSYEEEHRRLPDGVMYNVTMKSQCRQTGSESFKQFCQRLEDIYLNEPTRMFYREPVRFKKKDIANFKVELLKFFKEFNRSIAEKYFYMNTTECTEYGGCNFMRLCLEGPNMKTLMHYRVRKAVHEELEETQEA